MGANAMQSEAGLQADCSAAVRVYYAAPFLNCIKMGLRAANDSTLGSTLHWKRGAQRKTGLGSTWSPAQKQSAFLAALGRFLRGLFCRFLRRLLGRFLGF